MSAAASNLIDAPGKVRDENAFDPEVLRPLLKAKILDLPDSPIALHQFAGGASNITYQLDIGDRQLILRRPPAGTKAKSAHDMGREFRVMQHLSPHFPCPRPLLYCEDESLIGSTFYVMEKLSGVILRRDLPKTLSYAPEQARQLCLNLFDTLIQLHTLDYDKAGLGDLGKPAGYVERQVEGWCQRFEKAWTDDVPKCESLMAWIKAHRPVDSPRPALIHNDYRFDNVVLTPEGEPRIVGVLDWEMATIGDPLMDLGNALAYWVQADDDPIMQRIRMQPSHLPGMLTRDQIVAHYAEKTGQEIGDYSFYYVFGLFRLAVIAQQIYYRFKMGQTSNPKFQAFGIFVTVLSQVADKAIAKRG
jgi:aminoglycoside phosphotransferase (APT) family kinase protein